ncbi:thioredoxin [Crassaminicella thermophila]|uniref:Thioredoxin n=1 Tax=Crassaminicella thermophila TaxID=2599308 RepID=A0A5C0SDD2_CRATE|nr:thioredoxin [Crassaminicella thermophila]QEK12080.1 thioredoxin [Crassaminicella thermophila]
MGNENIVILSADNFEDEVLKSKNPVVVDFYADWCGPCQVVGPIMDELANELEGKVKICKVNVDGQTELARKFKVMSIPTILFYKNGEQVNRVTGASSKNEFMNLIYKML